MPLAEHIAPHLPNLRRFARLLTGSQKAGDTAVARLLEAIVADASVYPDLPPRIGLYQCFLSAFTTRMEDPAAQAEEIGKTAARSLAALPLQARQAFLLVSVEEFERKEAALILEVSESRIDDLLEQASREIGRQIATDVLIIEDEPLIAMDLQRMLQDLGTFTVPVVFVTAYPEKLMTGERPEPTFLITKPFREDAVKAIISQVLFFDQQARRRPSGRSALTS